MERTVDIAAIALVLALTAIPTGEGRPGDSHSNEGINPAAARCHADRLNPAPSRSQAKASHRMRRLLLLLTLPFVRISRRWAVVERPPIKVRERVLHAGFLGRNVEA